MLSRVAEKKMNMRAHNLLGLSGNRHGDEDPATDPRRKVVKSRRKKLEERWGAEHNDRSGNYKLSRDMACFHDSSRPEVAELASDAEVKLELRGAPPWGCHGPLLQLEEAVLGWPGALPLFEGVILRGDPRHQHYHPARDCG